MFTVEQEHDDMPGRPRYAIQEDQLQLLREIGFSWTDIARLIGVSVRTIFNRRIAFDMPTGDEAYSPISDQELHRILEGIIHLNDRAGERLVAGELRHRGHRIQYWRIRESLQRVDPIGRAIRRRRVIQRRQYSVPGANCLWRVSQKRISV